MKTLKILSKTLTCLLDTKKLNQFGISKLNKNSKEYKYLIKQRKKLGGFLPRRDNKS